ncbi:MAG TPA: DUF4230 domain-containing protein [Gaiellaceae bacterium]|nr:DUF4230 domain-containing protein [Gaiellaceae bacterium]
MAAALLVLVLWIAFGGLGGCFPHFGNPFRTETVDRSSPVVLKSIENLRRFQAATGHYEVIVDLEKDTRFVPAVVRGERVLFVAVGNVDAGVDFRNLDEDAVDVSNGRRTVVLELPHAEIFSARIDPEQSYVYDRDRGLVDRVASIFQDNPTSERDLYRAGEEKLRAAAEESPSLLARAELNTRRMLRGLLEALGFTDVTIRFVDVTP